MEPMYQPCARQTGQSLVMLEGLLQVYLAVPTNCPEGPNGEKKKLSAAESAASTVGMYVSDSQGANFQEVCLHCANLPGK